MKRADFQADTNQGVWAKSESMGRNAKAHFWKAHRRRHDYAGSLCGMLYATDSLVVADHHTQRCKRCEASK
jgi:hypothetical protein